MLSAILSTVRSCIHLLVPDGGAGSIAGLDLSVEGAPIIIFSFALWGSAQLIYSFIQLAVAFRYCSLVPYVAGGRVDARPELRDVAPHIDQFGIAECLAYPSRNWIAPG
jgi:hypothetical protein